MKRITSFIDLIISYLLAEKFLGIFSTGWTRFVRRVNANKLMLQMESIFGRTFTKKRHGKLEQFRYEKQANGQIRKVIVA